MQQIILVQAFGARVRSKDGLFMVTIPDLSGAQHEIVHEYPVHTVQSILLHRHSSISSDALILAEKHGTDIIVHDEHDNPVIFMAGLHPPGSVHNWKQQILLQDTPRGLHFARTWLCQKEMRKLKLLAQLKSYRQGDMLAKIEACESELQACLLRLKSTSLDLSTDPAAKLRSIEGQAQKVYLDTLSALLPARQKFNGRSRPAADLFNALLNYAYAILYNWVEKTLWQTGINPYYGFLHGETRKQKNFLFDFIEPYRPWVDKTVFHLCAGKELSPAQHLIEAPNGKGGLWLNNEGKKVLISAIYERFHKVPEPEPGDQPRLNRRQIIEQDARHFIRQLHEHKRAKGHAVPG